jgi:hypothetical protein
MVYIRTFLRKNKEEEKGSVVITLLRRGIIL